MKFLNNVGSRHYFAVVAAVSWYNEARKIIREREKGMAHYMKKEMIDWFEKNLIEEEKSPATIAKYCRDVRAFFCGLEEDGTVTKEIVIDYKQKLKENYTISSVNSMLAALNCFLKKMGWYDCVVKALKIQREAFRSGHRELTKEEYYRLLKAAKRAGNRRIELVMQTICATGMRVSELRFITVESLNTRRAVVSMKGKTRTILIPAELCRILKGYIKERKIERGSIFVTRSGRPLDRSNILHEMKKLCERANVERQKVFPHNLRHLFAITYYQVEKDRSCGANSRIST